MVTGRGPVAVDTAKTLSALIAASEPAGYDQIEHIGGTGSSASATPGPQPSSMTVAGAGTAAATSRTSQWLKDALPRASS